MFWLGTVWSCLCVGNSWKSSPQNTSSHGGRSGQTDWLTDWARLLRRCAAARTGTASPRYTGTLSHCHTVTLGQSDWGRTKQTKYNELRYSGSASSTDVPTEQCRVDSHHTCPSRVCRLSLLEVLNLILWFLLTGFQTQEGQPSRYGSKHNFPCLAAQIHIKLNWSRSSFGNHFAT